MKQLSSSKICRSAKEFFASKICAPIKQFLSTERCESLMQVFSYKLGKVPVAIPVLVLLLIVLLTTCSGNRKVSPELPIGSVAIETLNVHKKTDVTSKILGQLPYAYEVEIHEEKDANGTTWGRIKQLELSDGTQISAGWIDLHYVKFPGDEENVPVEEPEIPEEEPQVNLVDVTMGTITADKLNIRKGPESTYESTGAYFKGDRVEILETQTHEDTIWGLTNLGWISTGYVRMDGISVPSSIQNEDSTTSTVNTDCNSTVLGYGIVNIRELNVRRGPGVAYASLRKISAGNRYAYYQLQDGWARIEDGWVSLEHFYIEGTVTDKAFTAEVTTDDLNIRRGPYTGFSSVGTYKQGEIIEILNQINNWGYTEKGWVFLDYVVPYYSTGSGVVANGLNIRLEPSADSEVVGTYTTGDRVTILEVSDNWGRTDLGWIHLKSVIYDTSPLAPTAPVSTVPVETTSTP